MDYFEASVGLESIHSLGGGPQSQGLLLGYNQDFAWGCFHLKAQLGKEPLQAHSLMADRTQACVIF